MKRNWTIESAKRCLAKATEGRLSLTEAGAFDFLRKHGRQREAVTFEESLHDEN